MVSSVASCLVCVLCAVLLSPVWADYCRKYWGRAGLYHDTQPCGLLYCCGHCDERYCCSAQNRRLTQEKQDGCGEPGRSGKVEKFLVAYILGGVVACVLSIVLCVGLIACCVCPCCLFYKKCRKRRNQPQQVALNTTYVVQAPGQPFSPQPFYPGYQPVPVLHGYGGQPTPTAPPHSHLEAADPAHSPSPPPPGQQMNPLHAPHQPGPTPAYSELEQPPYNPSYGPNP